jgi:hypothetical protein
VIEYPLTLQYKVLRRMNPQPAEDLAHIRLVLDRHTRFLSLSGLSGVASGVIALIGATLAYLYLNANGLLVEGTFSRVRLAPYTQVHHILPLAGLALIVFVAALASAAFFTQRLATRNGYQQTWNHTSRRLAYQLFVCIAIGAVYCALLVLNNLSHLVAPTSLVFYGLGLYSASKYTLHEIRYLGFSEVGLGLIGMLVPGTGLLLWALGFGVLNIAYGVTMYYRYEAKPE